jgi:tRNA threonylcarbamoyl adenosine modification protein YeaZ
MNTLSNGPQQSINILAFDTSGDETSLALWTGGKMCTSGLPLGTGSHSQAACLLPAMQALLNSANIDFQDLQVIATSKGPGSFTGIRLGLATAQGLESSTKARCFAPTTFEIAAFGTWKEKVGSYLVTLSTKRDNFYTQGFDKTLVPLGPGSIQTEEEIQNFLDLNPQMIRVDNIDTLGAKYLILLYLHKFNSNQDLSSNSSLEMSSTLSPYYLHDPEFVKQKPWSL